MGGHVFYRYFSGLDPWLHMISIFWRMHFDHKKKPETQEDIILLYNTITQDEFEQMKRINSESAEVFLWLAGEREIPDCLIKKT